MLLFDARLKAMICIAGTAAMFGFARSAEATVSWSELELVDATGVPTETIHTYRFKGTLAVWHSHSESSASFEPSFHPIQITDTTQNVVDASFSVTGKGNWDGKTREAHESLVLRHGSAVNEFASQLLCDKDPWIYPASCVVLSAQYKVGAGKIWDFPGTVQKSRQPLTQTQPATMLAKAQDLSKRLHGKVQATKWPTAPVIVTPGQNQKVLPPVQILVKPYDSALYCTDNGTLWLSVQAKSQKMLSKPLPSKNCSAGGAIWALDLQPAVYEVRAQQTNTKNHFTSEWSQPVTFEVIVVKR